MEYKTSEAQRKASRVYYQRNREKILSHNQLIKNKKQEKITKLIQILNEKERIPLTRIKAYLKEAGI